MGRFVTGINNDFNYKFIFGNQGSNFGTVLSDEMKTSGMTVERFFNGHDAEIVQLWINDKQAVNEAIDEYMVEFEPITDEEWSQWSICKLQFCEHRMDQYMMGEFKKWLSKSNKEHFVFEVEY